MADVRTLEEVEPASLADLEAQAARGRPSVTRPVQMAATTAFVVFTLFSLPPLLDSY